MQLLLVQFLTSCGIIKCNFDEHTPKIFAWAFVKVKMKCEFTVDIYFDCRQEKTKLHQGYQIKLQTSHRYIDDKTKHR